MKIKAPKIGSLEFEFSLGLGPAGMKIISAAEKCLNNEKPLPPIGRTTVSVL
jgi:hypothetical protein